MNVIRGLLIVYLSCTGVFFVVTNTHAQGPGPSNEVLAERIGRNTASIDMLTGQNFDRRVSILEENMSEVKWLGRSVAGTLIVQLVMSWKTSRRRETADV